MHIQNVTGLLKRSLMCAVINIQKCNFEIFNSIYLENEQSCLHVFLHKFIASQGNSLCLLYTGQLAELSVILNRFFTGVANSTSTPIGWEGVGRRGAKKWWVKAMSSLKTANGIHWCHFYFHISHKAAKSMAKLISQLCSKSQSAVCLSREDGAI